MTTSISNDFRAELRALLIDTLCPRVDADDLATAVLVADQHAASITQELNTTAVTR